jgi:diguanylate cyclase (GGDEF)-like protein
MMGKSSLLNRVLDYAEAADYFTVQLDFQDAGVGSSESLNQLLRWFSATISLELGLKPRLDEYWDEEVGSKVSCSLYWQRYLLAQIDRPIVLALNNIDWLFNYPQIAKEFLALLRSWYEKARQGSAWRHLRFVVVYSTDAYVPLDINQSPFNVGLPLKLPPFNLEQIKQLAQRYMIAWAETEVGHLRLAALQELTGGHPYLVHLALYHLCRAETSLERLLEDATTESGIYGDHLRRLLATIQSDPNLEDAFKQIISSDAPMKLEPTSAYRLDGLGLVRLEGDRVVASCDLYRIYFKEKLFSYREVLLKLEHFHRSRLRFDLFAPPMRATLAEPSEEASTNPQIDQLTQVATRQQFDATLQMEWKRSLREHTPIALTLIDLDYFKVYNETYGQADGDLCLQKVAKVLQEVIQRPADLVARYGGEEFVVLLPQTDLSGATFVAETIRIQVAALEIACEYSMLDGLPSSVLTVSAGVVSTIPDSYRSISSLLETLDRALYQSKRQGRNRVTAIEV